MQSRRTSSEYRMNTLLRVRTMSSIADQARGQHGYTLLPFQGLAGVGFLEETDREKQRDATSVFLLYILFFSVFF